MDLSHPSLYVSIPYLFNKVNELLDLLDKDEAVLLSSVFSPGFCRVAFSACNTKRSQYPCDGLLFTFDYVEYRRLQHSSRATLVNDLALRQKFSRTNWQHKVDLCFKGAETSSRREKRNQGHRHGRVRQCKDHPAMNNLVRVHQALINPDAHSSYAGLGGNNLHAKQMQDAKILDIYMKYRGGAFPRPALVFLFVVCHMLPLTNYALHLSFYVPFGNGFALII